MNAHTHVLGGIVAAELLLWGGVGHPAVLLTASAVGSLLPDWDHPYSTIGRWVPWPAVVRDRGPHVPPAVGRVGIGQPIWHRHQAHSLVGIGLASALVATLGALGWHMVSLGVLGGRGLWVYPLGWIGLGLFVGSVSHLVLDGFNQTPQWWFWPFSRRGFRWPWHGPVHVVDGAASVILSVVMVVLAWHLGGRLFPRIV
ncbi:metal-dependent hydrolase [Sulfobacillus thermosulfidooxidans]|uniref:metal-dependent hydrolase n=1 Tax=Sulfobacillus thermosulfidooxidans TaxID=28034 RepID=UPI0002DD1097|nr:metal-dependent hydrolase [Sulfobacillus thermosulfidooxidans]